MNFIKRQPPGRLIAAGFALVILAGAALLMLPVSVRDGAQVTPIDALFTSTSAVCVTGLIAIDTADHFTVFGRTIVALLIQVGGLGVTSVGVGFILVAGKRVGFKSRLLVREAMNMENGKGIVRHSAHDTVLRGCGRAVELSGFRTGSSSGGSHRHQHISFHCRVQQLRL